MVESAATPPIDSNAVIDGRRLRRAIEQGEIFPAFQPIVALPKGKITGFEVLARWESNDVGTVPPMLFIHVAERSGLMPLLTARLIKAACTSASGWSGNFRLSFNISPPQFQDATLSQQIVEAVDGTGFPLCRIQLEITETSVIDDLDAAQRSVAQLKDLGVRIVLDDFGTGFSSLTRLQALPFDSIKLDASFVRSMARSRESRKIVSAVIGLGQSLGMPVVAEGIETAVQARMLNKLGCDFGQGYFFARPSRADLVPSIIKALGENEQDRVPLNFSCNVRLAQLNSIYENAPFAVCFIDRSRRLVSANSRFAALFGARQIDLIDHPVGDLSHAALPLVDELLQMALNGSKIPLLKSISADGEHTLLSAISPAHDEDNEVVGISITIIDITEHIASGATRVFGTLPVGGLA